MDCIENILSVAIFVLPQQIRVTEPAPAFKVINKVNRSVTCSMHNLACTNTVNPWHIGIMLASKMLCIPFDVLPKRHKSTNKHSFVFKRDCPSRAGRSNFIKRGSAEMCCLDKA